MAGPLDGIKVIEFSEIIAGPVSGVLLSDLGADVIKVEPPWGDPWRTSPSRIGPPDARESRGFIAVNRGKRSIRIDLTKSDGVKVAHRLVAHADVVVTNHRPDVPAKLSIDYETLSAVKPDLVYCEITAFGRSGPESAKPGYDIILQARTGLMATNGMIDNGVPRVIRGSPLIDFATGYAVAQGVLAGLFHRQRTGRGQKIETSLMANALAIQMLSLTYVPDSPSAQSRMVREDLHAIRKAGLPYPEVNALYQQNDRSPAYRPYYRTFQTKDWVIAVGCLSEPLRKKMADAMGLDDPRFKPGFDQQSDQALESARQVVLEAERMFLEEPAAHWIELFERVGVPVAPLKFVEEMVFDEQAIANGMIVEQHHPIAGTVRTVGPILKMTDSPNVAEKSSPMLGEHSTEVLSGLGYTKSEIESLIESGAVLGIVAGVVRANNREVS
ncbi:MAG: CoA transferase [Chloroflexi bacterium]|nr:CoA transferase [Chloroflexota bacterium]